MMVSWTAEVPVGTGADQETEPKVIPRPQVALRSSTLLPVKISEGKGVPSVATVDEVKTALARAGYVTTEEGEGQHCRFLKLAAGQKVNVYTTGKVLVQGKNPEPVRAILDGLSDASAPAPSRKVFVVYGHDHGSRTALEAMLSRWSLEPVVLDHLTSEGDTLIEKLERYSTDVGYAVVLATPDDEGHRRGHPDEAKARARQNVVLELGMLLARLGRKRVAILMPSGGEVLMERPSDIDGLVYLAYHDSIEDVRIQLAKELSAAGLSIEMSKV